MPLSRGHLLNLRRDRDYLRDPLKGRLEFNSCPARIRSQAFLFLALMLRRDAWQRSRNKNARWRAGMS
jgi:hypothetical protein